MEITNNSTLKKPKGVFAIQTIFAKPFMNVSKIEVFTGQNFHVGSLLC